ncbi:hypothetical protein K488DRAFT_46758, partial [Vararia minispora EC-137]
SDPRKSASALYDGRLELTTLMAKSMDDATLAFLSACQTVTGDAKLPEEAVHLVAGILAVDYRSIVGTMWSVGDNDALLVADEMYGCLREDPAHLDGGLEHESGTAYALHGAVKTLRESVGERNAGSLCSLRNVERFERR